MATIDNTSTITISTESKRCVSSLAALCTQFEAGRGSDGEIYTVTLGAVQDALGRFRIWASNIGATQPVNSSKSLDYRLRDSPQMRSAVLSGLNRLLISIDKVMLILSGLAPNRGIDMSLAASEDNTGHETSTATELQELVLTIHDLLNHLFGLSMLIRRKRPRGRLPAPVHSDTLDSSPDIINLGDKFPKLKQNPWLLQRLGNATAQRRYAIQYRQTHRKHMAQQTSSDDTKTVAGSGSANLTTVATTFQEPSLMLDPGWSASTDRSDRLSVITTATSFISNFDDEGTMGRKIPDLADMVLDGVHLEYGVPFECPYCRTIQLAADRIEWKRHVYADLQPYICTFEDCPLATTHFDSRHEWFSHEREVHRQRWYCPSCSQGGRGDKKTFNFGNEDDLRAHFTTQHKDDITSSQLSLILQACKMPLNFFGPSSCLFCDEWANQAGVSSSIDYDNTKRFCRHLTRHLQQIALDSLPLAIEGLEIHSPYNSDESDDTDGAKSSGGESEKEEGDRVETDEAESIAVSSLESPGPSKADVALPPLPLPNTYTEPREDSPRINEAFLAKHGNKDIYVRALYDYDADEKTKLSFQAGDIIKVMMVLESGWWDGVLRGVRGWFPSNYTEIITEEDELYDQLDSFSEESELDEEEEEYAGDTGFLGSGADEASSVSRGPSMLMRNYEREVRRSEERMRREFAIQEERGQRELAYQEERRRMRLAHLELQRARLREETRRRENSDSANSLGLGPGDGPA